MAVDRIWTTVEINLGPAVGIKKVSVSHLPDLSDLEEPYLSAVKRARDSEEQTRSGSV